jgi:hypothetical protein
LATLLLLGLARPAQSSRIHYRDVALPDLVRDSQHIFVVRKGVPERRQLTKPIHPDQKKYPPFVTWISRYQVVAVLKGGPSKRIGKTIEVWPGDYEESLHLHQAYYLRGLSISPIKPIYRSAEADLASSDRLIVFLRDGSQGLAFTVSDAVESAAKRNQVLALIRGEAVRPAPPFDAARLAPPSSGRDR